MFPCRPTIFTTRFSVTNRMASIACEAIQSIILSSGNAMEIAAQARKDGVKDLRESGLLKVKQGLTTIEEVLGATNE